METIAKVTIRCFVPGMALLMLWFFLYATADDWMYDVHSEWFELSKQDFAMMHYCGMMFLKVLCFFFFLFPYIACKWCGKEQILHSSPMKSSKSNTKILVAIRIFFEAFTLRPINHASSLI